MAKTKEKNSSLGMDENVTSLLAYLGSIVTGIIFFIIEKKSTFVKFHSLQSIILGAVYITVSIVISIFFFIIERFFLNSYELYLVISGIGGILSLLLFVGFIVISIICMIKAYQMEGFKIPVIGDIAEKQITK